jgi:hypothetical protein
MKRTTLLLLALLATAQVTVQAQEPMDLDRLENRRGVYLQRPSFEPYTGPVVAYWENGRLREKGTLVDGRWDGVRESYYALGTLKARETYSNGVLNGPFEAYFKKGAPSDKGTYVNGRLDGPYQSFWLRQPAEVGEFNDGRMCGHWIRYFPRSSYGLRVESTADYPPCPAD